MRRLLSLCLAALLLLSVGLPASTAPSPPNVAQAVDLGITVTGGSSSAAKQQDILVSKGAKGENSKPAIAENPNNGDLFVVWTRFVRSSLQSEVWGALLKRKRSGKYKKKPRARLFWSERRFGFTQRASVAWIEANREFLVVWAQSSPGTNGDIVARPASAKTGKPIGKLRTLVSDGRINNVPIITAAFADGTQNTQAFFTSGPAGSLVRALVRADLSDSYEVDALTTLVEEGTVHSVINGVVLIAPSPTSRSGASSLTGSCVATIVTETSVEDSVPEAIVRLFLDEEETFKHEFGEDTLAIGVYLTHDQRVFEFRLVSFAKDLTTGRLLVYVTDGRIRTCELEVGVNTGTPAVGLLLMAPFLPNTLRISRRPSASSGNRGASLAYIVASENDGKTYWQLIDEDPDVIGTRDLLFDHRNTLTSMTGIDLGFAASESRSSQARQKSNSVLVWTKSVGKDFDQEIRAHVFYLKPLE